MTTRLPLTDLPRKIIDKGYTPTTYRALYLAALDARIPASKDAKGRWGCDATDLPAIADAMGLTAQAHAA